MKGIKGTVSRLLQLHQTNDPFEIAKDKDITILYQDLGKKDFETKIDILRVMGFL